MKEQYFTPENIFNKAKELKKEMELIFKHPKFEFSPKNTALLVMDMQKFFGDESSHAYIPSFSAIIPNIEKLINSFQRNNLPVIFTKHINTAQNAGLMAEWWGDTLSEDSELADIVEDFDISSCAVIKKSQYDAFYKTELEDYLRKLNIKTLVITGVMTHLCCETTARAAFVREFKTFFVIDGTATYNENFHRNSIINLSHGFSVPVMSRDIMEKFNG